MKFQKLLSTLFIVLLLNITQSFKASAQSITGSIGGWQDYAVAICSDSNVITWGDNYYGQLGTGNNTSSNIPIQLTGISSVKTIVACSTATCALKNDGTVWTWGGNYYGELGIGSNTSSTTPVQVTSLFGITKIARGLNSFFALKNDGTVWAWGSGSYGQLGNGSNSNSNIPVQVSSLTNVIAIDGPENSESSLALKSDGTVWGWGDNYYGQLGNGTNFNNSNVPVQASSLTGIIAIDIAGQYSLALKNDGTVWTWGYNGSGLGNGSTGLSNVPVQVSSLAGITKIAAEISSAYAIMNNGTVWAWGSNSYGELGNGTTTNSTIPVQVNSLTDVISVSGGYLALKSNGTVWAWGNNGSGQLGIGSNTNTNVPVQVTSLSDITAVNANSYFSYAIKNDGTTYSWGSNYWGQLGNGTTSDANIPVQINTGCQLMTTNCLAYYTTSYDSVQNNFTLTVDSTVLALAVAYHWDFGDGTTSSFATPSHAYAVDSLYNVCMEIYTASGESCTYCHVLGIDAAGNPVRDAGFTLNVTNADNTATNISDDQSDELQVIIYPNPFSSNTMISFDKEIKNAVVRIIDVLGKTIKETSFSGKQLIVEKETLKQGIYFLQITGPDQIIVSRKIVVQ